MENGIMATVNRDPARGTHRHTATVWSICVFCKAPIRPGQEIVSDFFDVCLQCDVEVGRAAGEFTQPRYLVLGSAPLYGGRDEFVGERIRELGSAYTYKWAEKIIDRIVGPSGDWYDVRFQILDTRPGTLDPTAPLSEPWYPHCNEVEELPF